MSKKIVYEDFSDVIFNYRGCKALDLFKLLDKSMDFDPFEPLILEDNKLTNIKKEDN